MRLVSPRCPETYALALAQSQEIGEPGFSLVTQPVLSLLSFRHDPGDGRDLDAHNPSLVTAINDGGRPHLTQPVDDRIAIRFQTARWRQSKRIDVAFEVIRSLARKVM